MTSIYFEINAMGWLWFFLGAIAMWMLTQLSPNEYYKEKEEETNGLPYWRDIFYHAKVSLGRHEGDEQRVNEAVEVLDEAEQLAIEILTGKARMERLTDDDGKKQIDQGRPKLEIENTINNAGETTWIPSIEKQQHGS